MSGYGYAYHTVPVALQAWLRNPDNFSPVIEVIRCGGDTDTVAAIVGGILGARLGKKAIPIEWLQKIWGWPRSTAWMEQLDDQLTHACATAAPQKAVRLPWWGLLLRSGFYTYCADAPIPANVAALLMPLPLMIR